MKVLLMVTSVISAMALSSCGSGNGAGAGAGGTLSGDENGDKRESKLTFETCSSEFLSDYNDVTFAAPLQNPNYLKEACDKFNSRNHGVGECITTTKQNGKEVLGYWSYSGIHNICRGVRNIMNGKAITSSSHLSDVDQTRLEFRILDADKVMMTHGLNYPGGVQVMQGGTLVDFDTISKDQVYCYLEDFKGLKNNQTYTGRTITDDIVSWGSLPERVNILVVANSGERGNFLCTSSTKESGMTLYDIQVAMRGIVSITFRN